MVDDRRLTGLGRHRRPSNWKRGWLGQVPSIKLGLVQGTPQFVHPPNHSPITLRITPIDTMKTVKIGDSVVSQIAVGLQRSACNVRMLLNFDHVAWYNDAYLDS